MVKIETWEFFTEDGNTPSIDNTIYFNAPSSIKFTIPGTIDGVSSGKLGSYNFASSPGQSYTLSARIKAQGVLGTDRPIIRLTESDINDNWLRETYLVFEKGTYDWTQKSMNVVTGANTAFVYIVSYLKNSYGTYWLDDVNITGPGVGVCPALSASLSITPTTIVSGGSITFMSTAIGGQHGIIGDDAFGHEILIDGVSVYNTGLGKATTMTGTLQITGISPGSHAVTSRITDGCLPIHQVATSPPTTLTVNPIACPALSASLQITPTTIVSGGSITFMSTAIGGQHGTIGDDAFGHEILIDGVSVYNTGLGKDTMATGALQITGISPGTHSVRSRITDGCLPIHQVATSPPTTLTVNPIACPSLSTTLTMIG